MMRIALFLITNVAILLVFGVLLSFIGVQLSSIQDLLIIALMFGFSGSLISLLISKWIALKSVGGKIIKQASNDTEAWLMNSVAQQATKVKIMTPQVAIYNALDINAFATGACRDYSLIAISTGLLRNMSRNEAEAVIAHEISHIANGDMVTMTLIQGVLNTFVFFISHIVAQITMSFLNGNKDNTEAKEEEINNNSLLIYSTIIRVLELIFGILASIITMWFSRHREFYADAGAARLVGRDKMIAALQRLKTSCEPQEEANIIAFCINGKSSSFNELFMTHPSLDKRIEVLLSGKYIN